MVLSRDSDLNSKSDFYVMEKKAQVSLDYLLVFAGVAIVFIMAVWIYLSSIGLEKDIIPKGFDNIEIKSDNVLISRIEYDKTFNEVNVLVLTKKKLTKVTYKVRSSLEGNFVLEYQDIFDPNDETSSKYRANSYTIAILVLGDLDSGYYDLIIEVEYENGVKETFIKKRAFLV